MSKAEVSEARSIDPTDRRVTWYEAVKEKTEAEIIRNESLAFIESLEEPLTILEKSKDGKSSVSVFMTPFQKEYRENYGKLIRTFARSWFPIWEKSLPPRKPGQKIAVVLTREK